VVLYVFGNTLINFKYIWNIILQL